MLLIFLFQPLRLDIKRKLSARSDRVKSVDLHPTEPWMLASLYNGNVHIWNVESQVSERRWLLALNLEVDVLHATLSCLAYSPVVLTYSVSCV